MVSKRKLLLADDSETVQKVVNLTFDLEGVEVITFSDGDSAMAQFSAVAPDVVLADVNMPGMSGYDICKNIKSNEATKNTPVILLVGSFEPFDEQKAMEVGADDYLTKPFQSIRQLVSKVNELLGSNKIESDDEQNFDETLRMENNPYLETDFGDPGMDDEMIHTNQVSSVPVDETVKFETQHSVQHPEVEDVSKTQPLSRNDWQEIYPAAVNAENSEQTVYELADDQNENSEIAAADFEEPEEQSSVETVFETADEQISENSGVEAFENNVPNEETTETKNEEDFGLQPDDIDHFYKEPDYDEAEDEIEIQQFPDSSEPAQFEPSETVSQSETGFQIVDEHSFQFEEVQTTEPETENTESIEPVAEKKQMSSPTLEFDFDDFDLLDIHVPQTRTEISVEQTPEEKIPEAIIPEVEEKREVETEQVKSEVTEQLSGVNLSAADIDAIAEKVVEKLTARMKE